MKHHVKVRLVLIALCAAATLIFFVCQSLTAVPGRGASSRRGGDSELLARLIRAEAEAEPYLGKVAVGAVILNRIQNPRFPKTLAGVVYQPHAFESVSNGQVNRPATTDCLKAAQAALNGWDPSNGALFFFNPAKVFSARSYVWSRRVIQKIGKHVFAL